MSEVICHEEEEWEGRLCVNPKKEREGLSLVKEKKEICVGELLRSGILVKIMAQVYMSMKQEGLNG